jgi:hypothetical protein
MGSTKPLVLLTGPNGATWAPTSSTASSNPATASGACDRAQQALEAGVQAGDTLAGFELVKWRAVHHGRTEGDQIPGGTGRFPHVPSCALRKCLAGEIASVTVLDALLERNGIPISRSVGVAGPAACAEVDEGGKA